MDLQSLDVRRITRDETKPFILLVHYARRMPQTIYSFGLFENNKLIGVCTFGYPATPAIQKSMQKVNDGVVLELNRLVINPDKNGNNYGSYFVSRCLKMLPEKTYVVSYADSGWSHCGYIYQVTNWLYTGKSEDAMIPFANGKHFRHNKLKTDFKEINSGKYRYIYLIGNRKQKKEMIKNINWKIIKEYPKIIERKYDTNNPKPFNDLLGKPLNENGEVVTLNTSKNKPLF